jgi:hypothetical protein
MGPISKRVLPTDNRRVLEPRGLNASGGGRYAAYVGVAFQEDPGGPDQFKVATLTDLNLASICTLGVHKSLIPLILPLVTKLILCMTCDPAFMWPMPSAFLAL